MYAGKENPKTYIYSYDKQSAISVDKFESCQNVAMSQNAIPFWIVQANGEYIFIAPNRQTLDITNGIFADGTNLQIFTLNNSVAQKWKIVQNADGSCSFLAKGRELAMTYGNDGSVYLSEYHEGEKEQCWWINM